jgi:hypothetical protein
VEKRFFSRRFFLKKAVKTKRPFWLSATILDGSHPPSPKAMADRLRHEVFLSLITQIFGGGVGYELYNVLLKAFSDETVKLTGLRNILNKLY